MNMVWVAILALVAGLDGRAALSSGEVGRPAAGPVARSGGPAPSPSHSVSAPRRLDHRHRSTPWSSPILDDYDAEEQDESWFVQLDLLASLPVARLTWALPGLPAETRHFEGPAPCPIASFPMRC